MTRTIRAADVGLTTPTHKKHALEDIVLGLLKKKEQIDVTDLTVELAGCHTTTPIKGIKAYRIVASDVLGYMTCQGKLVMEGKWTSPRCPEKGGPTFRLPDKS